jgi:cytochrome c-type biogenesis protein CcmH
MSPASRLLVGLALGLLALAGCDRAIEPYVPGEKPEMPDLARIFPEGAEKSAQREAEAKGGEPAGPPMGGRGAPPATDEAAGAPIRGTVSLAPELASRVPAGAVLFLIARHGESGPPLAVQRIPDARLPFQFSIGPGDRMIQQMPFEGPLRLSARLDADGNAMTRLAGDLQGAAPGEHTPGDDGVAIVIDQVL